MGRPLGERGRSGTLDLPHSKMRRHAAFDHAIAGQLGVRFGMVAREVKPSALQPIRRTLDDKLSDGGNIAKLEEISRNEVFPIIFDDFVLQERNSPDRSPQPRIRADDTDVVPHEPSNFIPVLRDDDRFIAQRRPTDFPLGHVRPGKTVAKCQRYGMSRTMTKHQPFQERIAREAIRTMKPRARDSPIAHKPGIVVRPSRFVVIPPHM